MQRVLAVLPPAAWSIQEHDRQPGNRPIRPDPNPAPSAPSATGRTTATRSSPPRTACTRSPASVRARCRSSKPPASEHFKQLAQLEPTHTVPHLAAESFAKLRDQAAMQQLGRDTGKPQFKLIEGPTGIPSGLLQLPDPDDGDVYFDMEGDPLYGDDGLEYLFGVWYRRARSRPLRLQRHSGRTRPRAGKARVRVSFMDWLDRPALPRSPCHMRVYHYAVLRGRPRSRSSPARHSHARGAAGRVLLRERRLVDLYQRRARGDPRPRRLRGPRSRTVAPFYRGARQRRRADRRRQHRLLRALPGDRRQGVAREDRALRRGRRGVDAAAAPVAVELRPNLRWRGCDNTKSAPPQPPGNPPSAKLQAYLDQVEAAARCPPDRTRPEVWPTCSSSTAAARSRSGGRCSRAPS